jgi:DNA polymerase
LVSSLAIRRIWPVGPSSVPLDGCSMPHLKKRESIASQVYVTNAVKHFSWIPRGKRRIHKTPTQSEIAACLDWLEAEIKLLRPRVIVCLGATAAKALLGRDFRVSVERGRLIEGGIAPFMLATVHPSSILRITDDAERKEAFERLAADLAVIVKALAS